MRIALVFGAALAAPFGFELLLNQADFYAPVRLSLSPMAVTIAQAHGGTLTGVAAIGNGSQLRWNCCSTSRR